MHRKAELAARERQDSNPSPIIFASKPHSP